MVQQATREVKQRRRHKLPQPAAGGTCGRWQLRGDPLFDMIEKFRECNFLLLRYRRD